MHLSPLVRVIDNYAILHHTTLEALTGPSQKWPLVHLRQEAYYLCCIDPSQPTMGAIGNRFHRDRTTVMSGIKKHCAKVGIPVPDFARYPQRRSNRPQMAPSLQQEA